MKNIMNIGMRLSVVAIGISLSFSASGSGSFQPSTGGPGTAAFNEGKAIVTGRIAKANCSVCHKKNRKFKRKKIVALDHPISVHITNCKSHMPCFRKKLTEKELAAIDAYFNKRYKLK